MGMHGRRGTGKVMGTEAAGRLGGLPGTTGAMWKNT